MPAGNYDRMALFAFGRGLRDGGFELHCVSELLFSS